jgi:hypothetical protein
MELVGDIFMNWIGKILRLTWSNITAVSTLILALGTIVLAMVSCRQVGIMEADQRPWIGMASVGIDQRFDFANGGHFILEIGNSGRSPALEVTVTLLNWNTDIKTVAFPIPECTSECRIENIEMIPGSGLGMTIPNIEGEPSPLPKAGDTGYIIARIDYKDSRGNGHITGMCFKIPTSLGSGTPAPPPPFGNGKPAVNFTPISCAAPNSNYAT